MSEAFSQNVNRNVFRYQCTEDICIKPLNLVALRKDCKTYAIVLQKSTHSLKCVHFLLLAQFPVVGQNLLE